MAQRKQANEYAETQVLPEHLSPARLQALDHAAAHAQGRYQEYVRGLDDVRALVGAAHEPSRVASKDFRLGQRPDIRKQPREDAAVLREQHANDILLQYAEYAEIAAAATRSAPPRERTAKPVRRARGGKKRAKRAKRSARSKS
jgi:hypothetical protein